MSQKTGNLSKWIWVLGALIVVVVLLRVFVFRGERFTTEKLLSVRESLMDQDYEFLGRTGNTIKYEVTLYGRDGFEAKGLYRVSASKDPLPGLIVVHDLVSDSLLNILLDRVAAVDRMAVLSINIDPLFEKDGKGLRQVRHQSYGRAIRDGIRSVDLAVQYVRGHNLVDPSRCYLAGMGIGNLAALPSAAVLDQELAGLSLLNCEAGMAGTSEKKSLKFAAPETWAPYLSGIPVLMLDDLSGGHAVSSAADSLARSFTTRPVRRVIGAEDSKGDPDERLIAAVGQTIAWTGAASPVSEEDSAEKPDTMPEPRIISVQR